MADPSTSDLPQASLPELSLSADGRVALALAVVVDVALNGVAGPVGAAAIADRLGQSPRGIEPLLQTLSRAGILASARGRGGGYRLARARREITAGEVARAVQTEAAAGAPALIAAVVTPALAEAAEAALGRLDGITVEALCRRAVAAGLAPEPPAALTWTI
ncbi:RrF2 family transcriptional regulator [Elioraea thermophila]|uniref:RrF2 family transcriptional regulator n=1 Tax=Elioraea thermophila TaxID=2185104 RepID=UPI000DF3170B|nr:Rrf2 family transcriptional regulator [Elioraea thermophila]